MYCEPNLATRPSLTPELQSVLGQTLKRKICGLLTPTTLQVQANQRASAPTRHVKLPAREPLTHAPTRLTAARCSPRLSLHCRERCDVSSFYGASRLPSTPRNLPGRRAYGNC
ncbi:hypothetical protein RRG08_037449 [Elysia crispata]|uniref:Uncharacterized protein n=1 Tax=Elysia crispata TaxID=231223 RepID=A0AAE0Y475_9GAST|nr:hypothetical protein RRG08_037449 [Elysia crispata]